MIEVKPVSNVDAELDTKALRVFLKALELLGGPRKLIEYRNLTWLPSLMEASYAIVLKEEYFKTTEDIAAKLGLTKQTVKKMLEADPEIVKKKLNQELEDKEVKEHTAGGLAKLAYREIKNGRDELTLFAEFAKTAAENLGITWAVHVLTKIRGLDFPVSKEDLAPKLSGIVIEGKPIESVLEKIEFPIKSPAELLHKIKQALDE